MKSKIDLYVINKVKEKRQEHGLSQLALANELEVSAGFIAQTESPKFTTRYNVQRINSLRRS